MGGGGGGSAPPSLPPLTLSGWRMITLPPKQNKCQFFMAQKKAPEEADGRPLSSGETAVRPACHFFLRFHRTPPTALEFRADAKKARCPAPSPAQNSNAEISQHFSHNTPCTNLNLASSIFVSRNFDHIEWLCHTIEILCGSFLRKT